MTVCDLSGASSAERRRRPPCGPVAMLSGTLSSTGFRAINFRLRAANSSRSAALRLSRKAYSLSSLFFTKSARLKRPYRCAACRWNRASGSPEPAPGPSARANRFAGAPPAPGDLCPGPPGGVRRSPCWSPLFFFRKVRNGCDVSANVSTAPRPGQLAWLTLKREKPCFGRYVSPLWPAARGRPNGCLYLPPKHCLPTTS